MGTEKEVTTENSEEKIDELLPKEIERRFLVKVLPDDLSAYASKEIEQGYLAVTEDGTAVRLRKKGDKYFQTVKIGSGKTRLEPEIELSEEQFTTLWEATKGKRAKKTRYEIPHESETIELDIYHAQLEGVLRAEIEFKSEEDSDEFTPPDWFGEEVTEDKRYNDQNLVLYGVPVGANNINEDLSIVGRFLGKGINGLVGVVRDKVNRIERFRM